MCIAEVQKDFTKCTGFSNIRSLRIQFLNFHTHSFLKQISLRTQVKTFWFFPTLRFAVTVLLFDDAKLDFIFLIVWIFCLDFSFLQFGSSVLEGTGARGLVSREGWYYLQQVEGNAVTQGKLEPPSFEVYERHAVRSFFPPCAIHSDVTPYHRTKHKRARQLIDLSLWTYESNKSVLVSCKLWYFCHRDSEQYTDTIYSMDINGKKSHRDQNEANASKFSQSKSFWRWN